MADSAPVSIQPSTPVTAAAVHAVAYAEYSAIAIMLVLAVLLALGIMTVVRLITRTLNRLVTPLERLTTYECGEEPVGRAWFRFNNRFYRIAIVFLACDTLLALILPVLPRFGVLVSTGHLVPVAAVVAGVVSCLGLAVAYAAAKGDFSWNKSIGFVAEAERRLVVDQRGAEKNMHNHDLAAPAAGITASTGGSTHG